MLWDHIPSVYQSSGFCLSVGHSMHNNGLRNPYLSGKRSWYDLPVAQLGFVMQKACKKLAKSYLPVWHHCFGYFQNSVYSNKRHVWYLPQEAGLTVSDLQVQILWPPNKEQRTQILNLDTVSMPLSIIHLAKRSCWPLLPFRCSIIKLVSVFSNHVLTNINMTYSRSDV